jgi:hypothetical protein
MEISVPSKYSVKRVGHEELSEIKGSGPGWGEVPGPLRRRGRSTIKIARILTVDRVSTSASP